MGKSKVGGKNLKVTQKMKYILYQITFCLIVQLARSLVIK